MSEREKSVYILYLICYDISCDKKRNKVFDKLKDFGMQPTQKSVFLGFLTQVEQRSIYAYLMKELKDTDDRALIIPLHATALKQTLKINTPDTLFSDEVVICI